MSDWVKTISDVTSRIDGVVDDVRGQVASALGIEDPIRILPYRGYGKPGCLMVKGRVLKDDGIKLREEDAPVWENVWNMFKRFATDEVPNAHVRIQVGEVCKDVTTNKEGFYETEVEWQPDQNSDDLWLPVELTLLDSSEGDEAILKQGEVMVVRDTAQFGVISDIDDTIVHTAATDLLKMISIAYLGNARSRRPFDGVPEFYRALQGGASSQDNNPIFYVSSSAWNMYDVFEAFMDLNQIPKGPIFLRDIELALDNLLSFQHESHKLEQIEPIFQRFPNLPFILIGDSGQRDPEIYRRLVEHYPDRILAVLIHNVLHDNSERQQQLAQIRSEIESHGSRMLAFQTIEEAADYARQNGWIAS